MKKNKLVLDRETITSLQSDALDAVAGGQAGCADCTLTGRTQQFIGCGGGGISRVSQMLGCSDGGGLSWLSRPSLVGGSKVGR